jgi:hypothetical protein
MDLDVIVVLCLALPFFGGIGYLIIKNRGRQEPQAGGVREASKENETAAGRKSGRKPQVAGLR